jgi:Predicted periplasmic solute-binding protein
VIYDRLARGSGLQLDTIVLYTQRRRSLRMSRRDLHGDSPHNTYRHGDLSPQPIADPGGAASTAAFHPAKSDWFWCMTTDPAHRITKFTDKEGEFVLFREEMHKHLGPG